MDIDVWLKAFNVICILVKLYLKSYFTFFVCTFMLVTFLYWITHFNVFCYPSNRHRCFIGDYQLFTKCHFIHVSVISFQTNSKLIVMCSLDTKVFWWLSLTTYNFSTSSTLKTFSSSTLSTSDLTLVSRPFSIKRWVSSIFTISPNCPFLFRNKIRRTIGASQVTSDPFRTNTSIVWTAVSLNVCL